MGCSTRLLAMTNDNLDLGWHLNIGFFYFFIFVFKKIKGREEEKKERKEKWENQRRYGGLGFEMGRCWEVEKRIFWLFHICNLFKKYKR